MRVVVGHMAVGPRVALEVIVAVDASVACTQKVLSVHNA